MKQNERTNKKLDHFPEDEDNEKSDNLKSNKKELSKSTFHGTEKIDRITTI